MMFAASEKRRLPTGECFSEEHCIAMPVQRAMGGLVGSISFVNFATPKNVLPREQSLLFEKTNSEY